MSRDRAAYMRQYRAEKRAESAMTAAVNLGDGMVARVRRREVVPLQARIQELEAEVQHLKRELASKVVTPVEHRVIPPGGFNTRPFTPVPKHK